MSNEAMRQNWTEGAGGWVANQALFDRLYAPATAAILTAAAPADGVRMLDVGCGTGTLLEAGVAAGAEVVGVDISPVMVEAARRRVPAATVLVADAQTTDLPGGFDRVVSRYGVMFFADPVAAFANLRDATSPGARLAFACWRGLDENPVLTQAGDAFRRHLPIQAPAAPGTPGPVAFADRDHLAAILSEAGWSAEIEPLDFAVDYGPDGVENRLTAVLGTSAGQAARRTLEPALGPLGWADVLDEIRADFHRQAVGGAVRLPAANWLVTAANRVRR